MKILIAYDGSEPAKSAIKALQLAGLPAQGVQAMVLTAAESHALIGSAKMEPAINIDPNLPIVTYAMERSQESVVYAEEMAENDAGEGVQAVTQLFPNWEMTKSARMDSPATAILETAEIEKPDLIVMGSHGHSGISRLFLGSVSLRVMREAKTSVRITRSNAQAGESLPPSLLLAFDSSSGSQKAVQRVLERSWPRHTQLHIVAVIDVSLLSTRNYLWLVGEDLQQYQDMNETRIEQAVHSLEREMRKRFNGPSMNGSSKNGSSVNNVTSVVCIGNPVHEILAEAKRVQADTIFMGSRGLSRLERMLLGSVAQGVVAHAGATVEIVR